MPEDKEKLLLFDIDGTILSPGKGAKKALRQAIEETLEEEIKIKPGFFAGKTDPMIISNFLTKAGCMHEEFPLLLKIISNRYIELLKDYYVPFEDGFVYKGIMEMIEEIMHHAELYLGLLTGNLEDGARIKLEPYGLNDYFHFGAFGNDGFMRTDLPPVALKRAQTFFGTKFDTNDVWVIGDTADDVMCGKVIHAKTIAIARNPMFEELINSANPDHVFYDTEDFEAVLSVILNHK